MKEIVIQLKNLTDSVRNSFAQVRAEMDDHLVAINQNTIELNNQFAFLKELEQKVDKLTERVDELFMLVSPTTNNNIRLNKKEQEFYLALNSFDTFVTAEQVGRFLGYPKKLAAQYLYNLQLKGVPIIIRNINGELFYNIDFKFKDLQERNNILNIDSDLLKKFNFVIKKN